MASQVFLKLAVIMAGFELFSLLAAIMCLLCGYLIYWLRLRLNPYRPPDPCVPCTDLQIAASLDLRKAA